MALGLGGHVTMGTEPTAVGFSCNPQRWERISARPIISGNGGDVHQVTDAWVQHCYGQYRLWCSCVGSDPTFCLIAGSTSPDGLDWELPQVVFSPATAGSWDDRVVESPSVLFDPNEKDPEKRYRMWYVGAAGSDPSRTSIGLAYSVDGIAWQRLDAGNSIDGCAGMVMRAENRGRGDAKALDDVCVLRRDGRFEMWYTSWADDTALCIGRATSDDGVQWRKDPLNPVLEFTPRSWEEGGPGTLRGNVCQPSVWYQQSTGIYHMWYGSYDDSTHYRNTAVGYAVSTDGRHWRKHAQPVFHDTRPSPFEALGLGRGLFVFPVANNVHLYYGGIDGNVKLGLFCARLAVTGEVDAPPAARMG